MNRYSNQSVSPYTGRSRPATRPSANAQTNAAVSPAANTQTNVAAAATPSANTQTNVAAATAPSANAQANVAGATAPSANAQANVAAAPAANAAAVAGTSQTGLNLAQLNGLPLAMAYVPMQTWKTPYEPEEGFKRGTIFPELDLPFLCGGGR